VTGDGVMIYSVGDAYPVELHWTYGAVDGLRQNLSANLMNNEWGAIIAVDMGRCR